MANAKSGRVQFRLHVVRRGAAVARVHLLEQLRVSAMGEDTLLLHHQEETCGLLLDELHARLVALVLYLRPGHLLAYVYSPSPKRKRKRKRKKNKKTKNK